jgi:hypothetical protein
VADEHAAPASTATTLNAAAAARARNGMA